MAYESKYAAQFIIDALKKIHDVTTDPIRVALMNTTWRTDWAELTSFDPENDSVWSDVSAYEITGGNGYTAITTGNTGGILITPIAVSAAVVSTNVIISLTTTAPTIATWTATGGTMATAGGAVFIQYNTTTPADSRIIMASNFGADYSTEVGKMFRIDLTNGLAKASIVL